ncbi:NUDIX hydrolase [Alkalihalobacillus sp. AL-G]|uniref:NUDIX hydrolase n=1 Tax=Alkalihalobacillus sp. AL-G TaxID=2926399 RepID=UPI00272DAAA7|nr:NUDIX hydrolase [Alkalihalobacillus sp. AL-G]WLD95309.1 NUDIX hydrolase [Alkalihalobacillus sp. AL-G]
MMKWIGSAAVCIQGNRLLMVQQGKKDEPKLWTVPSGGKEIDESFESCCLRELEEETGYKGEIIRPLHVKNGHSYGYEVTVHYFLVRIVGGQAKIQDPDNLIHEIRWVKSDEINSLELAFPQDLSHLQELMFIES